jgi:hypothetical protein
MEERAVPASLRDRPIPGATVAFFRAAQELAIRRAARDAHRSDCRDDPLECSICRAHVARIAEAKAALQRNPFA